MKFTVQGQDLQAAVFSWRPIGIRVALCTWVASLGLLFGNVAYGEDTTNAPTEVVGQDLSLEDWLKKESELADLIERAGDGVKGDKIGSEKDLIAAMEAVKRQLQARASQAGKDADPSLNYYHWVNDVRNAFKNDGPTNRKDKAYALQVRIVEHLYGTLREKAEATGAVLDENTFTSWRTDEAALIAMIQSLAEEVSGVNAEEPSPLRDGVVQDLEQRMFVRSHHKSGDRYEWPMREYEWARHVGREISAENAGVTETPAIEMMVELVQSLVEELRAKAVVSGDLSEESEVVHAEDDDQVWQYRGPRGNRNTKARRKGQEPLN